MDNSKCLNCQKEYEGSFCPHCGQKAATKRFSLRYFLLNDFVYGILQLDKGILFTVKELFKTPGHSIREYVQGKRVDYFNGFTLLLILIAVSYFFDSHTSVTMADIYGEATTKGVGSDIEKYKKIISLVSIPLYALVTRLVFKKSKQNYTENIVLATYMLCGGLLLGLPLKIFIVYSSNLSIIKTLDIFFSVVSYVYVFIFTYQYFSVFNHRKKWLITKSLLATFLIYLSGIIVYNSVNQLVANVLS